MKHFFSFFTTWYQFHQRFTHSFFARGAQKRKKDSQVINLFTLLGSARAKAVHKYSMLVKLTPGPIHFKALPRLVTLSESMGERVWHTR